MKNSERKQMNQDIHEHGLKLIKLFQLDISTDPVKLCKLVNRIENALHNAATDYCNGVIDFEEIEKIEKKKMKLLDKHLQYKSINMSVFFNRDPRGYSLKIDYNRNMYPYFPTDLSGYGIVCPDFSPTN